MLLGPVPQFFSEQPDKSLEELKKSPEFAFGCLQALVSKLVERGELSRQACFKLRMLEYSQCPEPRISS